MARLNNFNNPGRGVLVNRAHPLARGLVGCWLMNEGTGERVFDHSGYGNHGLMTNMDAATDWVQSPHGGALDFDGSDDYIYFGDAAVLQPDAWTIVATVRITTATWNMLCGWGASTVPGILLNVEDNRPLIYMSTGNYVYFHTNAWNLLTNGNWHNIVFTLPGVSQFDINDAQCIINGIQIAIDGVVDVGVQNLKNRFGIGNSNFRFKGDMQFCYLYNRVLSSPEIAQLYKNPHCFLQPPTSSRYRSQCHRHYNYKRVRR